MKTFTRLVFIATTALLISAGSVPVQAETLETVSSVTTVKVHTVSGSAGLTK